MQPIARLFFRATFTALVSLGLAATALACPRSFHASFTDTWLSRPVFDSAGMVGIQLDIAATGLVTGMSYPAVMLTNDHTIKFRPSAEVLPELQPREAAPGAFIPAGAGTYTIRDRHGDTLIVFMEMEQAPVASDGILRFSGEWTVVSGTGRYAKASGGGTWTGWAKPDDPVTQAEGTGGAEMRGRVDLAGKR